VGTLIIDACQLITFGNCGALEVITSLSHHRIVVGSRSLGEVVQPPAATALATAVAGAQVTTVSIDLENLFEQQELARFDSRMAFRNRGDAELLALASARGYLLASDERAVRSAAFAELGPGRVAGTVDLLTWAVTEGRLTASEAVELLRTLDVGPGIIRELTRRGQDINDLF
jgi:hypothetical protein